MELQIRVLVPNGRCGLDRLAAESGAMLRASYGRTTLSKHWHPDILFCHLPCRSPRRHAGSRRRWWRCSAACSSGRLGASEKISHGEMRPRALVTPLHFGGDTPAPTLQVNTAARGQQVQAVAMLGVALAWHSRLEGQPCAAALAAILGDCIQRLLAHFEKSLWERVTGMTRCDHYTTWPQSVPTQYCSRPPGRLPPAFAGLFRGVAVGACDGHHKVCSELNPLGCSCHQCGSQSWMALLDDFLLRLLTLSAHRRRHCVKLAVPTVTPMTRLLDVKRREDRKRPPHWSFWAAASSSC